MSDPIKLIHTLKGKAGISDEEYRAILQRCGGVATSKALDEPSARQVIAVLRGLAKDAGAAPTTIARTPGEKKIWGQWYQLQPYLPECDRCVVYFLGIISKVTGGEFIPGLIEGRKIHLTALGTRWTRKVIEALKARILYEQQRQGEIEC